MSNYANSINFKVNLFSDTNVTGSIGSTSKAWENIYSKNNVLIDTTNNKTASISASGLSANRTYTLPDTTGKIVVGATAGYYGSTLPSSGTEGQVFFKTSDNANRFKVQIIEASSTAGSNAIGITAPTITGYKFICWLGSATIGHINWSYITEMGLPSTNIWWGSTAGGMGFHAYALYEMN